MRFTQEEAPAGARVAARVGGTVITFADVRREAEVRGLSDDPARLGPGDAAFREALEELIDQRLLALEAARRNLQETPEARRRLAAAEERILGNVLVEQAVSDAVTENAIERVYEEQARLAPPAEEIRARHILVDTRAEADEVARLLAEGADFAQIAARVSQDPATRFEGGDLGYFTREGILPAFARVAFSTPVGAVSAPFQTEYGWHVVTVTDRRSQPRPELEAMRGNIVRFLTLQGIDALLAEIRETYPVTVTAGAGEAAGADAAGGDDRSVAGGEVDAETAAEEDGAPERR
ncbi:MAG: peptidylprolyl isomerase [Oceanicaulis sp.]